MHGEHVGVDNVRRRLAGHYGDAALADAGRPTPTGSTVAEIVVPLADARPRLDEDDRTMPKPLRVVLADDERPARRFLVNLLKSFPDVEVVGEAGNGKEAIDLIEASGPTWRCSTCTCPKPAGSTWRGW